MNKRLWWTFGIILAVIILATTLILYKPAQQTTTDVAKCIGENSIVYVQLGCHACETQEQMFGDDYQYLNVIDCFYERDKCTGIQATPTWEINGEYYKGVQSIDKLKELTGC
jgi:hypothetical protein